VKDIAGNQSTIANDSNHAIKPSPSKPLNLNSTKFNHKYHNVNEIFQHTKLGIENAGSKEGAVARPTGVGGREPPSSLHGRIHGVLSGEQPHPNRTSHFHLPSLQECYF